jgi:hypothetical protein
MRDDFWESLRQGFLQLRAECAIDPPMNNTGRLLAQHDGTSEAKRWRLWLYDEKDINGIAKRFEWYAQSAAARRGFGGMADEALCYWLQQLTELDALVHKTHQITEHAGSFRVNGVGRTILDVCLLSAEYCQKCEAEETLARVANLKAAVRVYPIIDSGVGETAVTASPASRGYVSAGKSEGLRARRRKIIKEYRREHDMNMADLARLAATSPTAIYGMVKGDNTRYSEETLVRFLKLIGVLPEQW